MSLKLSVGLSKKIGLPDYGSLGASCQLEIELDQSMLATNVEGMQRRIRLAYAICGEAVSEELSRGRAGSQHPRQALNGDARSPEPHHVNGHAREHNGAPVSNQRATEKQLKFARQLAGQIHGLGIRRLDQVAQKFCGKPLADVSAADASRLIDALKAVKEGTQDLNTLAAAAPPSGGADCLLPWRLLTAPLIEITHHWKGTLCQD